MYVEYQVPAKVKHPFPIVLIHGGGGSGLDWMGTVDGRRGWSTMLLEEGYRVYVVDRQVTAALLIIRICMEAFLRARRWRAYRISSLRSAPRCPGVEAHRRLPTPSSTINGRHGGGRFAGAVPVGGVAGRVVRQRHGRDQGIAGAGVA